MLKIMPANSRKAGFMNSDKAAVQRSRADGHIVGFQRIEKLWRFFDRRGEVGIGEKHDFGRALPASRDER